MTIPLDNLTADHLVNIKITHEIGKLGYGRRFTLNCKSGTTEEVVFHSLYLKAKSLAKEALKNHNYAGLAKVKVFTAKLREAEIAADIEYQDQDCFYKFRTAFRRFFGDTPWFTTHLKQIKALEKKMAALDNIATRSASSSNVAKLLAKDPSLLNEIEAHAENADTLINESVNALFSHHLNNSMTVEDFARRLLTKRPLSSFSSGAAFLRDGTFVSKTDNLDPVEYITPEEVQLSAFLVTATPTFFINEGGPDNIGTFSKAHQKEGIYYGISGADLNLAYIRPNQIPDNAPLWSSFFNGFTSFSHATGSNFYPISQDCILDKAAYKKMMEVRISTFLKDADNRAKAAGKKAFLHVIPIGLEFSLHRPNLPGPLRRILSEIQHQIYEEQLPSLTHIDTIHYNKFPSIHSVPRNPADKLEDDRLLLCAQYEANPNSYPGNGYWHSRLGGEGAHPALSSTIAELHNPLINPHCTHLTTY